MATFYPFTPADYEDVCAFFRSLNRTDRTHINWNWARWEWMYCHPDFDRGRMGSIGLWKEDGRVVGAAVYDQYFGEAFCGALPPHKRLVPEIVDYAVSYLQDENGLGIAANDRDAEFIDLLSQKGFHKAGQDETLLHISLAHDLPYRLPADLSIREIHFPGDRLAYKTVIWKGFDHQGDAEELQKMLEQTDDLPAHLNPRLCLAVADREGNFLAHCGCWYDEGTDYAYVEPVCVIPSWRKKGLGQAVVSEALGRCRSFGAREAYVISDQPFYHKLGFTPFAHYTFYWLGRAGQQQA